MTSSWFHGTPDKVYWTEIQGTFESDVFINMKEYPIEWIHSITKTEINKKDGKTYELVFKEGRVKPQLEQQYLGKSKVEAAIKALNSY